MKPIEFPEYLSIPLKKPFVFKLVSSKARTAVYAPKAGVKNVKVVYKKGEFFVVTDIMPVPAVAITEAEYNNF